MAAARGSPATYLDPGWQSSCHAVCAERLPLGRRQPRPPSTFRSEVTARTTIGAAFPALWVPIASMGEFTPGRADASVR